MAAGVEMAAPCPGAYEPYSKPALPTEVQIQIPVGGGGTSLARYQHPSAWAKAGDRFQEPDPERARVGPGTYHIEAKPIRKAKAASNAFRASQPRFRARVDDAVGPGTYAVDHGSIAIQAQRLRQEADLKAEMKRRLKEAEQLSSQDNTEKPVQDSRMYLTEAQKQQIENPGVGVYDLARKSSRDKGLSLDAQMKLALFSTFQVEKWHHDGASIPHKVLCDQEEPPRPEVQKPVRPGPLEMQQDRKISFYREEDTPGPGTYVVQEDAVERARRGGLSSVFRSTVVRDIADTQRRARYEQAVEEARKIREEDDAQRRQVGGAETTMNFTMAKLQPGQQGPTFGTTSPRFREPRE